MHVQSDALSVSHLAGIAFEQHYPSPASLPRNKAPELVIEDCVLQTMLQLKGPCKDEPALLAFSSREPSFAILGIRYFKVAIPPKQQPMTCNRSKKRKEKEEGCSYSCPWAIMTVVSAPDCIKKSSSMQALRSAT